MKPAGVLGETERLILRFPATDDLQLIAGLWTDPQVTKYIGGPRNSDEILDGFREYIVDPESFAREEGEWWWSIIERATSEFVGLCGLIEKEVVGEAETDLGYFLLPTYWGRGFAAEAAGAVMRYAFRNPRLESLIALVHPENSQSIAVARKLGMRFDRTVQRPRSVERHIYRRNRSPSNATVNDESWM